MKRKSSDSVYLDYAAATPMDSLVLRAMEPYFKDRFQNPSSLYASARLVKQALESARSQVAQVIGAKPSEIVFTAGGTESINLAIQGVLAQFSTKRIIATSIEHEATLATLKELLRRGHKVDLLPVSNSGVVDPQTVVAAIDDETVLVSVMYANNEIGTIQPIAKIAQKMAAIRADRLRRGIDLPLYLHTDACQAAGYLDLHVSRLGVDLMSLNGSKIYGPKQTGILYIRSGTQLNALIHGGGQEKGLRSGTENVAGAVGFAKSLELAANDRTAEARRQANLRDRLWKAIKVSLPDATINGHTTKRLPNNLNFSIPGIDGEAAVLHLDQAGIQASTGSACSTGRTDASHVLLAIGLNSDQAAGSLRLTLGRHTQPADIDYVAAELPAVVKTVRRLAKPLSDG